MSTNETGKEQLLAFVQLWPLEKVKAMTLDEYTNSEKDNAFIYWLEKKTENTGSIWGGSAFKFGIYRRKNTEVFFEKKTVRTDGVYGWMAKYGETRDTAFETVKRIIISIIEASQSGVFEKIDTVDLGDAIKWKIAYLYNPDQLIPIFNPKVLLRAAEANGLTDGNREELSKAHIRLISRKPADMDTQTFGAQLWSKFNLNNFSSTVEKFLEQANSGGMKKTGYPSTYRDLMVKVGFGAGILAKVPWLSLLKGTSKMTSGIYPAYLYYKEQGVLILAYGVSEKNEAAIDWPGASGLQSIEQWFIANGRPIPEKYGNSYVKAAYIMNEELDAEKIQTDLDELVDEYLKVDLGEPQVMKEEEPVYAGRRIWLFAPGESGYLWEEFYSAGIAAVGLGNMGDLKQFSSREEIREELVKLNPDSGPTQTNNSLCLWEFSHVMREGDIIIAKKGITEYIGYGIVSSAYYFDDSRESYKHVRKVDWKKKGVWEENVNQIVIKTLTDITKYPEYVDRLKRWIGIEQEATVDVKNIEYYWLNANPKYWKIEDFQVGQEQTYTTHNEKGNKRTRFEYFQKIKPGDLVIGYETTPIQKVVAIFEVTKGAHLDEDTGKEEISFKIQQFLPNPISLELLKTMPELANSEVMKNNQGSLFRLTKEEFKAILEKDIKTEISLPAYGLSDAQKEIFMDAEELTSIIQILTYKKNIILQGPPGVGKTYMARKLAHLLMGEKDDARVEMIQFHQSYSYEDFLQGFRPKEDGTFKLENGIFYRFCKRAQADPSGTYFFIIDEINRGNLSKIFGELMLLIEADKRGPKYAVPLTYSVANETKFYIPENIYFIGTMNTADRSLSLIDYALRRRFSFINVIPRFNIKFREELLGFDIDESVIDWITSRITELNAEIEKDNNLGKGFKIGHSYFCKKPHTAEDDVWYQQIIQTEIAPLIEEYWFDKEGKASTEIKRLYLK